MIIILGGPSGVPTCPFVIPPAAIYYGSLADVGLAERLRQQLNEFRTGHAQQDMRGTRRVDEGAQQIEQGANAQLPADGANIAEGRMKIGREQESEVPLVQQAPDILRSYVQREPQAFQSVRRTAG